LTERDLLILRTGAQLRLKYSKWSKSPNFTQGRIDAAHGRFSRIIQAVPMCTPIGIREGTSIMTAVMKATGVR